MKLYQKIALGLMSASILYNSSCGISERAKENEAGFRREESAIVRMIENESPFSQTAVEAPLIKEGKKEWYGNEEHYPFIKTPTGDVIYSKDDAWVGKNLYLSKGGNEKDIQKIAEGVSIKSNHIYSANFRDRENPDIYWVNDTLLFKNRKLSCLRNEGGKFVEQTPIALKDYFGKTPEYLELGDINGDGRLDLLYESTIKIGNRTEKVIKALIGKDGGFDEKIIYYLGESKISGLIARDVDNDGDSDLIFRLKGNDNHLFGLENRTKKNSSPLVFSDGFKRKIDSSDDTFAVMIMLMNMNIMLMTTNMLMNY